MAGGFVSIFDNAKASLQKYRLLEQNWDGDDAPAPDQGSADLAEHVIALLEGSIEAKRPLMFSCDHEGYSMIGYWGVSGGDYLTMCFYAPSDIFYLFRPEGCKQLIEKLDSNCEADIQKIRGMIAQFGQLPS